MKCGPTELQRLQVEVFLGTTKGLTFAPVRAQVVQEALDAADRTLQDGHVERQLRWTPR